MKDSKEGNLHLILLNLKSPLNFYGFNKINEYKFRFNMSKNAIKASDFIKCMLLLYMCKTTVSNADPKFEEIYLKMCSVLKLPRFCLPYMMGSHPYPYYALPLPPIPVPIAPFPLIGNPTPPTPSFTIPTVFTTNRPLGPGGPPLLPGPPPSAPLPPAGQCPPSPPICPPAALSMPFIDPRQGI